MCYVCVHACVHMHRHAVHVWTFFLLCPYPYWQQVSGHWSWCHDCSRGTACLVPIRCFTLYLKQSHLLSSSFYFAPAGCNAPNLVRLWKMAAAVPYKSNCATEFQWSYHLSLMKIFGGFRHALTICVCVYTWLCHVVWVENFGRVFAHRLCWEELFLEFVVSVPYFLVVTTFWILWEFALWGKIIVSDVY